eukprot:scaffold4193_cov133-Chaetoceros_neogracile.AAC.1
MALLMDITNEDDDDDVEHIHIIVHRQGQKSVNTEEHGVVFSLVCTPLQNENTKRSRKNMLKGLWVVRTLHASSRRISFF